jgi:hypothetical protein
MRKRPPFCLLFPLLAGVALAVICLDERSEPSYAGRTASDWITALKTGGSGVVGEALREGGPVAVPV